MKRAFPFTRHRRLRQSSWIRRLVCETVLHPNDFILPLFIREEDVPLSPLPYSAFYRYTLDELPFILEKAVNAGISSVMLFPVISKSLKDPEGSYACREENILIKAIQYIKERHYPLGVVTDVALDPYTSHGHDGLLINGKIDNDKTTEALVKMSLCFAHAGADAIAPSDMMDGRILSIRNALEENHFHDCVIISYSIKYASSFYMGFRQAVDACSLEGLVDKKTYQMSIKNKKEAQSEAALDIQEGADILIVKPGLPYLDVIQNLSQSFDVPIFSYQVSGEYLSIKAAHEAGYLDEKLALYETCIALKRAGSRAIITYGAFEILEYLDILKKYPLCK